MTAGQDKKATGNDGAIAIATPTSDATRQSEFDVVRAALDADYELKREIGRGGMAIVYLARERALDRDVAIKVLPAQFTFDESFTERFQREARVSGGLEHPSIVPVYRVGRSGAVIYFVMKYLRGGSLAGLLAERGALPAGDVKRMLVETASALAHAARRGVVHRDVKPDNIMMDEDGRCVVTDFGIARSGGDGRLTGAGMAMGTPRYMSPEQARAKPLDGRSDLYALGVVAYECLTGRVPFDGDDAFTVMMAHAKSPVPRPTLRTPEERELWTVIERMLAKDPEERYQSGDDVLMAFGERPSATGRGPAYMPSTRTESISPTRPSSAIGELAKSMSAEGATFAKPKRRPIGRQTWMAVGAMVALSVAAVGFHAMRDGGSVVPDDSRCARLAPASVAGGDGAKSRPVVFLLESPETAAQGSDVELAYDVCGLEKGTTFTTRVTITRNTSGLKKLFGGGASVATSFEDVAPGPALRRTRRVRLGDAPSGTYTVTVTMTDDRQRKRTRETTLKVR